MTRLQATLRVDATIGSGAKTESRTLTSHKSFAYLRLCILWLISFISLTCYAQASSTPVTPCEKPLSKVSSLYQLDSLKDTLNHKALTGKTIRHINIYRLSVFDEADPRENNLLFRLLNRVHIRTRESVIRKQLLFKQGDRLDIRLAQESERLLRRRVYLVDALIIPEHICGNNIDLAVITRDSWALEITAGVSEEGNQTATSWGARSTNLLGTGDFASISYQSSPERDKVRYQYTSPHLFGSRLQTRLYYSDNSDGSEREFTLNHPFYSQNTPIAYGFTTKKILFRQALKQQNDTVLSFEKSEVLNEAFVGYSPEWSRHSQHTQRIMVGIRQQKDEVSTIPSHHRPTRQYPWLSYSFTENHFDKFRNINQLHKTEDLNIGKHFYTQWGMNKTMVTFDTRYSDTLFSKQNPKHLSAYTIGAKGTYLTKAHQHENTTAYASFAYHYLVSGQQRWHTRWRYDQGFGLTADESLSFTDNHILRGYPSGYQFGNKRFMGSVEHRIFYDYHLFNLFRIGQVSFLDVGRAWGTTPARKPNAPTNKAIYDIGFGLRFSSTKSRVKNVVHADIAFPLNDRDIVDSYQFTLKTLQRF